MSFSRPIEEGVHRVVFTCGSNSESSSSSRASQSSVFSVEKEQNSFLSPKNEPLKRCNSHINLLSFTETNGTVRDEDSSEDTIEHEEQEKIEELRKMLKANLNFPPPRGGSFISLQDNNHASDHSGSSSADLLSENSLGPNSVFNSRAPSDRASASLSHCASNADLNLSCFNMNADPLGWKISFKSRIDFDDGQTEEIVYKLFSAEVFKRSILEKFTTEMNEKGVRRTFQFQVRSLTHIAVSKWSDAIQQRLNRIPAIDTLETEATILVGRKVEGAFVYPITVELESHHIS